MKRKVARNNCHSRISLLSFPRRRESRQNNRQGMDPRLHGDDKISRTFKFKRIEPAPRCLQYFVSVAGTGSGSEIEVLPLHELKLDRIPKLLRECLAESTPRIIGLALCLEAAETNLPIPFLLLLHHASGAGPDFEILSSPSSEFRPLLIQLRSRHVCASARIVQYL